MLKEIITATLRVPTLDGPSGDGSVVARQLDAALMQGGFKLSGPLLAHLSGKDPVALLAYARNVLFVVKELVGAHRKHNTYFRDFPANVPSTEDFWRKCLLGSYTGLGTKKEFTDTIYGSYQHTFEDMVAAHDTYVAPLKASFKVLNLGGTLVDECDDMFESLAGSSVPLSEDSLKTLVTLAEISSTVPEMIPVREHRAIINRARLRRGLPLVVDTVTDVLRLAAHMSGGDVTLEKATKFKSFSRPTRRLMLSALDGILTDAQWKVGDVAKNREAWKRLGERLHPHEFKFGAAKWLFAYARGDANFTTFATDVERAFAAKNWRVLVDLLVKAPGVLFRNLDRLLVAGCPEGHFFNALAEGVGKVSGRVLLSVREHFMNRASCGPKRIFTNSKGKSWVADNTRKNLHPDTVEAILVYIDAEVERRLPALTNLTVDEDMLGVALPLSEKGKAVGFGVLPRGSKIPVTPGKNIRFFVHWRETAQRTDYDLSVIMLDKDLNLVDQCSYTNLHGNGMTHSGDLTSAPKPKGATEFIEVDLSKVRPECVYLVPQVNVFAGETFKDADEAFFGFMERTSAEKGMPYEARTVKVKSDIRGDGKVALPLMFIRGKTGWTAKWTHFYLKGAVNFNRVEKNHLSTGLLAGTVAAREYLTVGYLVDLLRKKAIVNADAPATYVGYNAPEGVDKAYTPNNLFELIPD